MLVRPIISRWSLHQTAAALGAVLLALRLAKTSHNTRTSQRYGKACSEEMLTARLLLLNIIGRDLRLEATANSLQHTQRAGALSRYIVASINRHALILLHRLPCRLCQAAMGPKYVACVFRANQ